MTRFIKNIFLIGFVLCAPAWSAEKVAPAAPLPSAPTSARVISYGERDVATIKTRVRFTTLIMLPKQEQILDFTCGDKEFWVVDGSQNFAYVKPAKAGTRTNLNLITAGGNVYSFVLTEVSDAADSEPDLKVYVEPRDESMLSAASQPKFVPAQQVNDFRQQIETARNQAREAQESARTSVEQQTGQFRAQYPETLRFLYRFDAGKKPFGVTAMFDDGKFTYIQAHPEEPPAIYEIKDGRPNLIQFEFHNGTYVVAKILDNGYFSIGKQKLSFTRTDNTDQ